VFTFLLYWIGAHPGMSLVLVFMALFFGENYLSMVFTNRALERRHRETMAKIQAQTETARALAAAPEEAQRSELAKQLLEAYDELGEDLQNDNTKEDRRWE
jgi:hypothetical protein